MYSKHIFLSSLCPYSLPPPFLPPCAPPSTPQFVLSQAYDAIVKQKSPKTQENALLFINAVATEFGLKLVKAKPLLDFTKGLLEATNPGVKKAAVEVLTTMRRQIGPDVRGMLSDVKPALLATIDEAFGKVAQEPAGAAAPAPTRQVKVTFFHSILKPLVDPRHFEPLKTSKKTWLQRRKSCHHAVVGRISTPNILTRVHFACVRRGGSRMLVLAPMRAVW
jgi:hypothetical protein